MGKLRNKGPLSEDHKRKLSEAGTGKKRTPEQVERYRQAALKRWARPEYAEKNRAKLQERNKTGFCKGKKKTDEQKQHHSEGTQRAIEEGFKPWENLLGGCIAGSERAHQRALKREARLHQKRVDEGLIWKGFKTAAKYEGQVRRCKQAAEKGLVKGTLTLTYEEARELYTQPCHYCGLSPTAPKCGGIDRKHNDIGYTPGNCVPCCRECNDAKSSRRFDQWLSWVSRLSAHQGYGQPITTDCQYATNKQLQQAIDGAR